MKRKYKGYTIYKDSNRTNETSIHKNGHYIESTTGIKRAKNWIDYFERI